MIGRSSSKSTTQQKKILRRTAGVSYEQFLADDEKRDGLIRQLEIIGEAVGRITLAFRGSHRDLIPWSEVKAVRNLLIHGYDTVDIDEVWKMVTADVPQLHQALQQWMANNTVEEATTSSDQSEWED